MNIYSYQPELFSKDPIPTEYSAYLLFKDSKLAADVNYIAVPWATLINEGKLNNFNVKRVRGGFTVCQHVHYKKIIPKLLISGVDTLFAPHAHGFNWGIRVLPFPLFCKEDVIPAAEKDLLYSFIGFDSAFYSGSLLRKLIFKMPHPDNAFVLERNSWHLGRNNLALADVKTNQRLEYVSVLSRSRFSLCPRGSGTSSIRFWESLAAAAIPVLLSDKMRLPRVKDVDWDKCIIRVKEKRVNDVPIILSGITVDRENEMRSYCLEAYKQFSGNNLVKCIREAYGE